MVKARGRGAIRQAPIVRIVAREDHPAVAHQPADAARYIERKIFFEQAVRPGCMIRRRAARGFRAAVTGVQHYGLHAFLRSMMPSTSCMNCSKGKFVASSVSATAAYRRQPRSISMVEC